MFHIGEKVVCKTFPKVVNGINRDTDPNITIGKSYLVIKIELNCGTDTLKMLTIIGEKGECYYWSDYFYTKEELREMKINKICQKMI